MNNPQGNFYAKMPVQCIVDNGEIYQVDFYGQKTKIGVAVETYNELEKISTEYYNKLVELGEIKPPKTPEQIQQETMQMMSDMMTQMQKMKNELEELKNAQSSNVGKDVQDELAGQSETGNGMATGASHVAKRIQSPTGN